MPPSRKSQSRTRADIADFLQEVQERRAQYEEVRDTKKQRVLSFKGRREVQVQELMARTEALRRESGNSSPVFRRVKEEHDDAEDKLRTIAADAGRPLSTYFFSPVWYFVILFSLSIAEVPINLPAIALVFSESYAMAAGLALVMGVVLLFLAHTTGRLLRQIRHAFTNGHGLFNTAFAVVVIGVVLSMVWLFYVLRVEYLRSTNESITGGTLSNAGWLFLCFNLGVVLVGMIISFLHHDPDPDFQGAAQRARRAPQRLSPGVGASRGRPADPAEGVRQAWGEPWARSGAPGGRGRGDHPEPGQPRTAEGCLHRPGAEGPGTASFGLSVRQRTGAGGNGSKSAQPKPVPRRKRRPTVPPASRKPPMPPARKPPPPPPPKPKFSPTRTPFPEKSTWPGRRRVTRKPPRQQPRPMPPPPRLPSPVPRKSAGGRSRRHGDAATRRAISAKRPSRRCWRRCVRNSAEEREEEMMMRWKDLAAVAATAVLLTAATPAVAKDSGYCDHYKTGDEWALLLIDRTAPLSSRNKDDVLAAVREMKKRLLKGQHLEISVITDSVNKRSVVYSDCRPGRVTGLFDAPANRVEIDHDDKVFLDEVDASVKGELAHARREPKKSAIIDTLYNITRQHPPGSIKLVVTASDLLDNQVLDPRSHPRPYWGAMTCRRC